MEALQRKPLAFSSGDDIVSASSRIPLTVKDGNILNIEIFDGNTSESSPILLVTHGICESAETLGIQAIVAKAEEQSVKVAVLELQGHGLSSGQKGVCGDFDLLLAHFLEFVQVSVPELRGQSNAPYFITGNSLGGTIAIYAAEKIANDKKAFPSNFKGVASIAPAVGVDPRAVPSFPIVQCLKFLSCLAPAAELPLTPLEDPTHYNCPANSSRNYVGHWPLSTSKMLLDITSSKVGKDLKENNLSLGQVNSVLIVAAENDQVVPSESISLLHESINPVQKRLLSVPDAGHDLLFQRKSSAFVLSALFEWMKVSANE